MSGKTISVFVAIAVLVLSQTLSAGRRYSVFELTEAIRMVESGGRDRIVGDNGKAIGPFQIHYEYWKDARMSGRYSDCYDREYARQVVLSYWRRHATVALNNIDLEKLARVHNGGPRGWQNKATLGYWKKVKKQLEKQP